MSEQQHSNPLGYAPIGQLLLKFALPSVTAMIINAVYNIVDQIFIGNGVGYLGNAATTIAFPIVSIILAISTLFGAGGSAFAAIKLGEGKENQAEATLCNSLLISIIIGIIMTAAGLIFLDPIVKMFGASDDTIKYAKQYSSIILMAAPFNIVGIVLSNFARTDGNPVLSMYSMLVGAGLNVLLDPLFIFVFKMEVAGAAYATAISQILSAVILIYYFIRKSNMRITRPGMKFSFFTLKNIVALGISSCVLHLASTALNIILNNVLVYYGNQSSVGGDIALSAMGIVLKISMIVISVCVGISTGSQPILGYNRGANLPGRVRKTYITSLLISFSVTIIGWILFETIPDKILLLFGKENQVFTDFAVRSMRLYLGGIFVAGIQISTTGYYQATGQPLLANIMSLLRQVLLLIPLLLILPRFMGLDGVLYAGLFADLITGVIVSAFIVYEFKRLNRSVLQ